MKETIERILKRIQEGDVFGAEPHSWHRTYLHYKDVDFLKELLNKELKDK